MANRQQEHIHMLRYTLTEQLVHGMEVSNLAYAVAEELNYPESVCYELAIAGILHDIGKLPLLDYEEKQDTLVVEEMRMVRMHSQLGYERLMDSGLSDFILDTIHYHHENYDGSGYPANLEGSAIPFGARLLRICDVYCALTSDRPYRKAFDRKTAIELMIEEIKNFDIRIFLAFQRVVHTREFRTVTLPPIDELLLDDLDNKEMKDLWQ